MAKFRKFMAVVLALTMLLSLVQVTALAANEGDTLVCGLEEHTHEPACYELPDGSIEAEPICGKTEHTHTDDCYAPAEPAPEEPAEDETAEPETIDLPAGDYAIAPIDISELTEVEVDENITLTSNVSNGYSHQWSSDNIKVATVEGDGSSATVTGVAPGKVTITHTYYTGFFQARTETFTVTVNTKEDSQPQEEPSSGIVLEYHEDHTDSTPVEGNNRMKYRLELIDVNGQVISKEQRLQLLKDKGVVPPTLYFDDFIIIDLDTFSDIKIPGYASDKEICYFYWGGAYTGTKVTVTTIKNMGKVSSNFTGWNHLGYTYKDGNGQDYADDPGYYAYDPTGTLVVVFVEIPSNAPKTIYKDKFSGLDETVAEETDSAIWNGARDYTYYPNDQRATYNASYMEQNYSHEGYKFVGWSTETDADGNGVKAEIVTDSYFRQTVEEDVTLYAVWELKTGSLTITKEVVGGPADASTTKTYTFTVTDSGGTSRTTTVTGANSVTLNDLAPGTYTVTEDEETAKIDGYKLETTSPVNATVVADETAKVTVTNTYTELKAELSIEKKASKSEVAPGGFVVFTITVTNNGNIDATGVTIEDVLPDGLVNMVGSALKWENQTISANGGTWTATVSGIMVAQDAEADQELTNTAKYTYGTDNGSASATVKVVKDTTPGTDPGSDPKDDTFTLTVTKKVQGNAPKGDEFTFEVTVNGELRETQKIADGESFTVTMKPGDTYTVKEIKIPEGYKAEVETYNGTAFSGAANVTFTNTYGTPDLIITKEASKTTAKVGDTVMYTITVKNTGTAPAHNVVITDELPAGLTDILGLGNKHEWKVEKLSAGNHVTYYVTAIVTGDGKITNIATVESDETEPESSAPVVITSDNPSEPEKAKVTIKKVVEVIGDVTAPDDYFTFEFEMTLDGVKQEGTRQIKANESFDLTMDAGSRFIITETNIPANYTVSHGTISGTAFAGENTYIVTNTYKAPAAPIENTYTLTYDDNVDGVELLVPSKQTYTTTAPSHMFTVYGPNPTRDGYVFLGWSENKDATAADLQAGDNVFAAVGLREEITLYAIWAKAAPEQEIATVTIQKRVAGEGANADDLFTFEVTIDGVKQEDHQIRADESFTLTMKAGSHFIITEKDIPANYTVSHGTISGTAFAGENTYTVINTYKAPAAPKQYAYTLTYDGNAPEGSAIGVPEQDSATTENPTHAFTVSGEVPTCNGYVFLGWSQNKDATKAYIHGGDKVVASIYSGRDITLYAIWAKDENHNNIPDDEEERYTVTYTDGVNGEAFANQTTGDLLKGTTTPAFSGTPAREGYVFTGWDPEVAKTVTGDATYTAQWAEDKNGNKIPDDKEDRYTVTYTDGVDGEVVFADQVTDNLLSGTATPAFEGTVPDREGYVFVGWSPDVAKTVTANATYTAVWAEDTNHDGKPDREEKLYTVTYHPTLEVTVNNVPDSITGILTNTTVELSKDRLTAEGYVFLGWTLTENPELVDAEHTYDLVESVTINNADVDVYAVWAVDANNNGTPDDDETKYNVTYSWTGSIPAGAELPTGETGVLSGTEVTVATVPAVAGYTFSGWTATYVDENGETQTITITDGTFDMPAANVTITGSWTQDYVPGPGPGTVTPDPVIPGPGTPETPDEPDTPEIPDEEPPLADEPEIPDEDTPTTDLPDEDVPQTDLPEQDAPATDLPDEEPPLANIPEADVPLDEAPKTGDETQMILWLALLMCSGLGLTVCLMTPDKKRKTK